VANVTEQKYGSNLTGTSAQTSISSLDTVVEASTTTT